MHLLSVLSIASRRFLFNALLNLRQYKFEDKINSANNLVYCHIGHFIPELIFYHPLSTQVITKNICSKPFCQKRRGIGMCLISVMTYFSSPIVIGFCNYVNGGRDISGIIFQLWRLPTNPLSCVFVFYCTKQTGDLFNPSIDHKIMST